MSTKLIETCAGSAALESRAADTGGSNWVKTLGPTLTCNGSGLAVSGTPGSDSEYHFAVNAGTAYATVVFDFYLDGLSSTSYVAPKIREQSDTSTYLLSVAGNGNVILYHRSAGGSYTALNTFASGATLANWCRADLAINSGFQFTLSLWSGATEGDLGSGPALVVNAATYTDAGNNIAAAGRTGFQSKNASLSYASLTDSASAGPVITGRALLLGVGRN